MAGGLGSSSDGCCCQWLPSLQQHQQTAAGCQASSIAALPLCSWQLPAALRIASSTGGGLPHQREHVAPRGLLLPSSRAVPLGPRQLGQELETGGGSGHLAAGVRGCAGQHHAGGSGVQPGAGSSQAPSVLVPLPLAAAVAGRARQLLPEAQASAVTRC